MNPIIWLASYPRSGSTLLRMLLYQTMGLASDSLYPLSGGQVDPRIAGSLEERKGAMRTRLVKTHSPPTDDAPFIYVARDGRCALDSYFHFQRESEGRDCALMDVILGREGFGDWSQHLTAWLDRPTVPRLVMRFEEMVSPDGDLLARLAAFVGVDPPRSAWRNPFAELHAEKPGFYRHGRTVWQRSNSWTDLHDQVFALRHGRAMVTLGYWSETQRVQAVGMAGAEARALVGEDSARRARESKLARFLRVFGWR